jgi:hypothetical protein
VWAHYTSIPASPDESMSNGRLCGVNGIFSVWPGAPYISGRTARSSQKNHDISQLPCDLIVPHRLVLAIQAFKGSNHCGSG